MCADVLDESDHCYRVFEPDSGDAWLATAAAAYVELRTACAVPLTDISVDGIGVFDTKALKARLAKALVPVRSGGNFDVVRSDFGEVLAYALLEQAFGTRFACKITQDRELVQQPAHDVRHRPIGGSRSGHVPLLMADTGGVGSPVPLTSGSPLPATVPPPCSSASAS